MGTSIRVKLSARLLVSLKTLTRTLHVLSGKTKIKNEYFFFKFDELVVKFKNKLVFVR